MVHEGFAADPPLRGDTDGWITYQTQQRFSSQPEFVEIFYSGLAGLSPAFFLADLIHADKIVEFRRPPSDPEASTTDTGCATPSPRRDSAKLLSARATDARSGQRSVAFARAPPVGYSRFH